MAAGSTGNVQYRIRRALVSTPALERSVQAARALVHFGPWRHAARAVIRWNRPPLQHDASPTPGLLSLNVPEIVRSLRSDGMARAGRVPADMLRRVCAVADDLPPGEYGDFHELPDVRALVLGPDVLEVVRAYLGAEPELIECSASVARADRPDGPFHPQRHFHFDFAAWHSVNLFVYLTDIADGSGAHQVVAGTHRHRQLRDAVRPWVPDEEIDARYSDRLRTIAGPTGTMFFENTEAFHRRVFSARRRVLLNALYVSHRSWLSQGRLTPKYSEYVRAHSGTMS